jgi:mono/diheme cytochrome c family protein
MEGGKMIRTIVLAGALLLVGGLTTMAAADAHAVIRTMGSGEKTEIDPTTLPADMREGYALLVKACLVCHGQDRILQMIRHAQEQKHSSEETVVRDIKEAAVRNLRRPGVDLSRQEGKTLLDFLVRLWNLKF